MLEVIARPFQFSMHSLPEMIFSYELVIFARLSSFSMKQVVRELPLVRETFLYIFALVNQHVFCEAVKVGTVRPH